MFTDINPTGLFGNVALPDVAVSDIADDGLILIPPAITTASFSPTLEMLSSLKTSNL